MRAENLSERTIATYLMGLRQAAARTVSTIMVGRWAGSAAGPAGR
jgi:hypothetical protein